MNLEEYFLKQDFIMADDKYIADTACLISKEYIKSKALKIAKNTDDIFKECNETVPYERGEDFDCTSVGTNCKLLKDWTIGICYNERYFFDYKYVSMLIKQIPYWKIATYYVVENKYKQPVLKIFVDDEFVACLMPIDKEYCKRRFPL